MFPVSYHLTAYADNRAKGAQRTPLKCDFPFLLCATSLLCSTLLMLQGLAPFLWNSFAVANTLFFRRVRAHLKTFLLGLK